MFITTLEVKISREEAEEGEEASGSIQDIRTLGHYNVLLYNTIFLLVKPIKHLWH